MKPYLLAKRLLDLIGAIILLVFLLPVMVVAALAIKMETPGSALFSQIRPGKNGKPFRLLKLRSMRIEEEQNGRQLSSIERITRVGRILRATSIDELPQLINIIRGEMSFIGPRPLLVQYLDYYTPDQMRRHEVMPGVSGWAQVNGRNAITWEEKFSYDLWYVDHVSLLVDLRILLLTLIHVVLRRGVNKSSTETMPFFTGTK